MKYTPVIILLFAASFCAAQKHNTYFLKNDGTYVDIKDSADYMRIVSEPDSGSDLYNVAEYFMDGKKRLVGKSSAIDPPKYEGQCVSYYRNGRRKNLFNYKNGVAVGDEYDFYPNGKPYLLKEHPDNNNLYNDFEDNYLIKAEYDSLGVAWVENGSGTYKEYDGKFKEVTEQGTVNNGKREGVWKGHYKDPGVTFVETYKDGELISGGAKFTAGDSTSYTKSRNTVPEYKGRLDAFYKYLAGHIEYPDYERANNIQGKVILGFVVEKDGKITDIKVMKSVSKNLDAEAVRVIKRSRNWVPGTRFGKQVRVAYEVPIAFALAN